MIRKIFSNIFSWLNFFGTVTVFAIMFLLQQVVLNLDFESINVVAAVMADYNVTDIVFSRSSKLRNEPALDTNIVIVNIGGRNLDRADLAQQIMILNKYKPKVIGIDIMFKKPRLEEHDSLLEIAFSQTENLVLGTKIEGDTVINDKIYWKNLLTPIPRFYRHADKHGFLNTISTGSSQFETWRETAVQEHVVGQPKEYSFAVEVSRVVNPQLVEKFVNRQKEYEIINYRGNIGTVINGENTEGKFVALDVEDVIEENFEPEVIRNKIVLLGYLGESINSTVWDDDKYYTPMNERQVGRTQPDMYGVVGHANIVSMILSNEPIDEVPAWFDPLVAFVLCYINVVIFSLINFSERLDIWYGVLTKFIQIFEALFLTYLIVLYFADYRIKLDFTITVTAVLLAGDILEIYYNLFLNLFDKAKARLLKYLQQQKAAKVSLQKD